MKNWIFPILLVMLGACQQSSSSTSVANAPVNLDGFEKEKLANSSIEYVVKRDENGKILEEGFMNGAKMTGTWSAYNPETATLKSLVSYLDGELNGIKLEFDDRRRMTSQTGYKNGQLHGLAGTYNLSYPKEEFEYVNGVLNGVYRKYFENSTNIQQESNYKNGQLNGKVQYFNKNGETTMEFEYKNGEKVSGGIIEQSTE